LTASERIIYYQEIFVTAEENGKEVVEQLDDKKGSYKIVAEVGLPSSIIGYFIQDNKVYLAKARKIQKGVS
jgi:hypothetical protein